MTRQIRSRTPSLWLRVKYALWRLWRRDIVSTLAARKQRRPPRVSPAMLVALRREELSDAVAALERAQFEAGREAMRRELTDSPVGAMAREIAKDLEVEWPPPVKPYAHG